MGEGQMKMTDLRKALALILCAVLCAGLLPAAFADDANGLDYPFQAPALGSAVYLNDGVHLSWNYVWDASRYGVFRRTNGGPWRGIAVGNSLSYRDEDVEPGATYTYTVCVISGDGKSILSPYDETGLSVTIPSGMYAPVQVPAPVMLDARNVSGGVQVSWQPVSGASKYGIFRRTNGGPWRGLALSLTDNYTDAGVEPGNTYTYTVCCIAPDGRTFQSSYDQNGLSVTAGAAEAPEVRLATPVMLDARNVGDGVRVSWQPVSGAPQYGLFRSKSGGPWRGLAVVSETGYTDKSVEPGAVYTYTVCCLSADGKSFLSAYDETGRSVKTDSGSAAGSVFTVQPTDTTVRQMTYAAFTVAVRDTGTRLYYQWEMRARDSAEWVALPQIDRLIGGVDAETMIIAAVAGLDGYSFRCLVSDGLRSEVSNAATLHVTA